MILKVEGGITKEEVVRFAQFRSFDVLMYFKPQTFNTAQSALLPNSSFHLQPLTPSTSPMATTSTFVIPPSYVKNTSSFTTSHSPKATTS